VGSAPTTAAQSIRCSRTGLAIVSASAAAMIRGRFAVTYTMPVTNSRMNAATSDR
jgi:hypothetical protein